MTQPTHSTSPGRPDPTRRDVLRTAGHGVLAASLAAPLTSLAAPAGDGGPATPDKQKASQDQSKPASANVPKSAGGQTHPPVDPNAPLAPPDKQPPQLKIPKAAGRQVGYAIVGLGQLALEEVLPAFRVCERSRPVALVSGHPDKARQVAQAYGIAEKNIYDYKTYDSIRDNSEVDAIYIILPNTMHAEYTIRGLRAGKHVLCEKPMAVSPQECEAMIEAGKQANKKLMIAYRLRYEPYNRAMIDMARKQEFGPIRLIEASNMQDTKAPNIRLSKDLGGGALLDVGIYCLNAARYITGEEPVEVSGWTYSDPNDPRFREVDGTVVFTLRFPSGALAHCSASHGSGQGRRYRVYCADGWMELDPSFSYRGLRMHTSRAKGPDAQEVQENRLREVNHFAAEMDHFSECVLEDKPPLTPGEEGLKDLRVIAKIFEAAKTGNTVRV